MKKSRILISLCLVTVAMLVLGIAGANAEWKPEKPITIIVPTNPGDYYDSQARVIASEMEKELGQPVTVEYMPGAGQAVAYEYLQRAEGDGYTLGYCALTSTIVNQLVYERNYNFHDWTIFSACYNQENDPAFLYVPIAGDESISGIKDWNDVLNYKGTLRWASVGEGSVVHIAGVVLQQYYGLDIQHVLGYNGGPECVTAVARGEADLTTMTIDVCRPYFESGDVKPAFTIGMGRSEEYPDVPSMSDDHPELVALLCNKHYMAAPPNMDPEVAAVLDAAIWKAMNSDAMKELHTTSISNGRMYLPVASEDLKASLESTASLFEPLVPLLQED